MPQVQRAAGTRGNSATAKFKPKRWQVEDQCGLCGVAFSLVHTRHHCRHCGLSVCGKHSKNKVIVPTSLSKVPQRVCDKCYPVCRNAARGLAPPPPEDKPRRHTLEADRRRGQSPRTGSSGTLEGARRDNRTWNGDDDYEHGPRQQLRRDGDQRRERRVRSPHSRDPRELSSRGKRDKPARDGALHPRDLGLERDPREKDRRRSRDPRERERRSRDPREKEPRDRARRDRALHERDLFEHASRERRSRDSPAQKERRRIPSTDSSRNRKHEQMRSPVPSLGKRVSGKVRGETPSTCRTTSSTLSNLYAAVNATEEVKAQAQPRPKPKRPPPRQEKKEEDSAFADSTFSIFSLAGSDAESKARKKQADKKRAERQTGRNAASEATRESMEKKEHLDFSASSSSVKSFEVSAITQKYLKPAPAKAAKQKPSLQPMIEEDSESEESRRGPSRRKAAPERYASARRRDAAPSQRRHDNRIRGAIQSSRGKMLPPFQRDRPVAASFRSSSELMPGGLGSDALAVGRKPSPQNSGAKSWRASSISDDDGFQATHVLLSGENSFSDEDEALAELIAASNRGKQDLAAKLRAKKEALAGIDAASLDAQEKAPTTANYQLTERDRELMRQISELEAVVLRHQKELPDLLDMYSEATRRAKKAQKELQKAKARVARYEKAHAAVARAIRTGRLYMKQKEYMAAILELARAAGIERSNATLWYMLAECRLEVGQPAAAEEACMTSLKLQPTEAGVALLGRILHKRGRDEEAIECYLSALGRNDESEDEEDESE